MIAADMRALALWLRPPDWQALPDAVRPRVRALAWFAIATQALFVVGWVAGGLLEHGYSPTRDYISELGRDGAAHPWTFQVATVIWGLGFIALALAMAPAVRDRRWGHVAPALFLFAGVFAKLLAPFRLDCAATESHACRVLQNAGALSWHDYAHIWGAFGIEMALWLTPVALARATWPGRLARLLLAGALAMGGVIGAVYLTGVGEGAAAGLVQRLELLIVHGWVFACAGALIAEASAGWPPQRARAVSLGVGRA